MGMSWLGYRLDPATAAHVLADDARFDELLESDDERALDLDKTWHGIHWLLTGSSDPVNVPASSVIFGGAPCGADRGYGPPRLLPTDEVAAAARALQAVSTETLRSRVDPEAMTDAELYPLIWDEEDVFDEDLLPNLEMLRSFYEAADTAGEVVIQLIT